MKGNPQSHRISQQGADPRAHRRQPVLAALPAARRLGLHQLAKKERAELIEEMHHADKLVDRIIFLEGFPNMQHIDP